MSRKPFKHLTLTERLLIEKHFDNGKSLKQIAEMLDRHPSTIYREIKKATYKHTKIVGAKEIEIEKYAPETAFNNYRKQLKLKGQQPKLLKDEKLKKYFEEALKKHYSPEAILYNISKKDLKFDVKINSVQTIYNYFRKGTVFPKELINFLPIRKKKKKQIIKRQKRIYSGISIEKRQEEVNDRIHFGHWEMDCIEGAKSSSATLLVIIERKTRYQIIEKMKNQTVEEVRKAVNRIEKTYGRLFYPVFKTITVDCGSEFADADSIEKALYRVGKRTTVYRCHPYSPWERGSNENNNRFVRRIYPKGSSFVDVSKINIKKLEAWINDYPRKMFKGESASERFKIELEEIYKKIS